MDTQVESGTPVVGRRAAFARRDFRRYYIGYATSLFGSAMAGTAATFAFLGTGRGASDLGLVMAMGIVPILLCLPVSGVIADRLGCRRVLLFTDGLRFANRAAFAVTLLAVHRPPVWVFMFFAVVQGAGEGIFFPAYSALIPRLVDRDILTPANALLGIARSATTVLGPTLSGILIAAFGSALVLGVDSASFAVCFVALFGIRMSAPAALAAPRKFLVQLREGWSVFASHPWLWMQTLQFALFNFMVWAPLLVLGPTLSDQHYGGARAWGIAMGSNGLGAILGGGLLLRSRRREPRRPLVVAIIFTAAYALAPGAFALRLPLPAIAVFMALCGAGTAISGALYSSVEQRVLPADALARVSSYNYLGAFAIGPIGLAIAGPVGAAVGYTTLLGFGATYQIISTMLLLAVPAGRRVPATYSVSETSTSSASSSESESRQPTTAQ
jgi:MFS family permease